MAEAEGFSGLGEIQAGGDRPGSPGARPFDVVFADTCIGGSTVAARLAETRKGLRAAYLADYAVNPLGVKSRPQVRAALDGWVDSATGRSDHLIVACNTASVLLRDSPEVLVKARSLGIKMHSMVDFVEAMVREDPQGLAGQSVCLMGTEFTVGSPLYTELLRSSGAASVQGLPATRTEAAIAHLRHHLPEEREAIEHEIGETVRGSDAVLLACTCFPMVGELIQTLNPSIRLLDPGRGVQGLGLKGVGDGPNLLTVVLTGEVMTPASVEAQAPALFPGWDLEKVVWG